ncbi:MAG: Crp/Fnr family transcriptional regulator [Bacteroidales bacterium]
MKSNSDILIEFISRYMPLSDEEAAALVDSGIFRTEKKGTVLLREGQYSEESFFVLQGCLRSYYIIDGEEKTTAFYTEMEGVSSNCAITRKPSEYYIACLEDSIISVSNPGMEQDMYKKFPRFETLCRVLSERFLSDSQRAFDEFKTSSPEQRYLSLLKHRPDLVQRVPQHQLASYLGITPQSLSRLRARIIQKKK